MNLTMPRKPAKTAAVPAEVLQSIILRLVSGAEVPAVRAEAIASGSTPRLIDAAIAEAQRAIALTADVDRRRELGVAYKRLNTIYQSAIDKGSNDVALKAQRELNRLLSLHNTELMAQAAADAAAGTTPAEKELAAVAAHLLPLKLAPESHPLAEHARVAADLARRARAQ